LGVPKPVTLEGEVSEGPRYKVGQISFGQNRAFSAEELREAFPLKKGALMERAKIAAGLDSLRKLYGGRGYLDYVSFPETMFGSNAVANLKVTIEEGPQYHMGKVEIIAEKELGARLRANWTLSEGDVYDFTYLDDYLAANQSFLPTSFSRENVQIVQNCPEALVHVRLIVDPTLDTTKSPPQSVLCEEDKKEHKKDQR
jgi:outer membrane protein assembly factor BamA